MVAGSEQVDSALLLTRNAAAAAPVRLCRENVDFGAIRAAAVKSGNANAATGEQGMRDAIAIQQAAAEELDLDPSAVAIAATGKIGEALPMDKVLDGIRRAAAVVRPDGGAEFSEAIMTTDRGPEALHRALRRRHPLRPGEGRGDDPARLRDDALLRPDRRRPRRPLRRRNRAARGRRHAPSSGSPSTAR